MKQARQTWSIVAILAFGALGAPYGAGAADLNERRISFGGFGTIGMLYHNEDGLEYRRSLAQPSGAESGKVDLATDSIGGVQVNAAWNNQLDAVVQAVTRLSAHDDWDPQLTRAFVRYNPNETLTLRVGRLGWEIYPRADSRDVGYSQLGIRPPVEIFGLAPTDHFDGGELALRSPLGNGLVALKLYGGSAGGKVVNADGTINNLAGSKLWGGHVEYRHGAWLLRLGSGVYEQHEAPPLDGLAAGLRMTGVPQAVALSDDFAGNGRKALFLVGGIAYDEGPMQARLFGAHADSENAALPDLAIVMLTGGYRVGDLTPYASFSFSDNTNEVRSTGLPDLPQFAALNAGTLAVQSASRYEQQSLALGLRYDFLPRLALKLQVDQVWLRDSRLVFDSRPAPSDDAEMTVFGLALDFVF